ncbi:prolipoprotein diacylglyceryl transferase [Anaeroselena agilis]|uniref:Phosphatidylglycerol--prolipoprotein diacylglyceryl transferase n=1 Tax=Anaeroselena agilis TaxID=3063788 RepID=A0ABU3NS63_9FIRM|nr:prolipoprotein diacylglyceryl transferase [Selenomonadales bacterium 4137-cl]
MHPILFTIGDFHIRVWGIMVGLGIIAGYLLVVRLAKGSRFTEEILTEYLLYGTIAGFVGARVWEIVFTWQNYAAEPIRALMFWQGGLSIQGAVVANVLLAWWYMRRKKLSFRQFADLGAIGLILGQAFGRIGCFFNGDAYGMPTDAWYGVIYQPGTPAYNAWGPKPLVPAELFEAILDFGILAILLLIFRRKKFDGQVALWYFILYSTARFFLEFLRADSLMIGELKAAQVTAALMAAIAGGGLLWMMNRPAPLMAVPSSKQRASKKRRLAPIK